MTVIFELKRQARGQGGDRYEAPVEGEAKPWVVYFPQTISRPRGRVRERIAVVLKQVVD